MKAQNVCGMEPYRRHRCIVGVTAAAVLIALLTLTAQASTVNIAGQWTGGWLSAHTGNSGDITTQISESGSNISGTIQITGSECTEQVSLAGTVTNNIASFNASCLGCTLKFTHGVVQSNTINGSYAVYCGSTRDDWGSFTLTEIQAPTGTVCFQSVMTESTDTSQKGSTWPSKFDISKVDPSTYIVQGYGTPAGSPIIYGSGVGQVVGQELLINLPVTSDGSPNYQISGTWQFVFDFSNPNQVTGSFWGTALVYAPPGTSTGQITSYYNAGTLTQTSCPQ